MASDDRKFWLPPLSLPRKKWCVYIFSFLLACSLWTLPGTGYAVLTPTTANGFGPDDFNTSTLTPSPATQILTSNLVARAVFNAHFDEPHGWNFTQASAAQKASVLSHLTINDYFAWVVNEPDVVAPNNKVFPGRVHNVDAGGAVFSLTYTPQGTDPIEIEGDDHLPVHIRFIQAYRSSFNGSPPLTFLDNGGSSSSTPFYNLSASGRGIPAKPDGTPANPNAHWFVDTPLDCEVGPVYPSNMQSHCTPEGIEHFHAENLFQVLLAADEVESEDTESPVHNVTLYGGYEWGYNYTTQDVISFPPPPGNLIPEPSTWVLLGSGLLVLMYFRKSFAAP